MRIALLKRLLTVSALMALTACSLDSLTGVRPKAEPVQAKAMVAPVTSPELNLQPAESVRPEPSAPLPTQVKLPPLPERKEPLPVPGFPLKPLSLPVPPDAPEPPRRTDRQLNLPQRADMTYQTVTLAEDVVWSGDVQVSGWVTVPQNVTLKVEAGTKVSFTSEGEGRQGVAGLLVLGRLVVGGTSGKPVLFTGSYVQPEAGDWQGIVLLASEKKNLLEQCRLEGASVGIESLHAQLTLRDVVASACGTGLRFRDSIVSVAGGGVSGCELGIQSADSELDIRDISVSSNAQGVAVTGGSLYLSGATLYGNDDVAMAVDNGKLKITGSSFSVNGTGLRIAGSEGIVSFNRLLSNRESGLHVLNSRIRITGNEISQNSRVGLKIEEGGNVLWGNILAANNGDDLEYSGGADLAAMGNWWGVISPDKVPPRIRRGDSSGRVLYLPVLSQRPQSGI